MAEADDGLFLIDGEDAGAGTPWEWSSIVEGGTATFALSASAEAGNGDGSNGYRLTADGATLACYGRKNFSSVVDLYVRFYVKLQAGLAGIGSFHLPRLINIMDGGSSVFVFGVLAGGASPYTVTKWSVSLADCSTAEPTTNFSLGAWHRVELRAKTDAVGGTGGGKIWIDGDLAFDDMDQNWAYQPDRIYIGQLNKAFHSGDTVDFDDIKAAESPIGAYTGIGGTIIPHLMQYYRRLRV